MSFQLDGFQAPNAYLDRFARLLGDVTEMTEEQSGHGGIVSLRYLDTEFS
jgi:hypothetical protein